MAYSYLIPLLFSRPVGYSLTVAVPAALLRRRLAVPEATVRVEARAFCEGEVVFERVHSLSFTKNGDPDAVIVHVPAVESQDAKPGFLEIEYVAEDKAPVFATKAPPELYGLYDREGRQSFRADGSYKFGAPSVIASVAENQTFVESYPVVSLDLDRDCRETISVVNPYTRALLVSAKTSDGREIKRQRVNPRSAGRLDLTQLLKPGETKLETRLQLTATNRVLTYHVRHDGASPPYISDHEHLDIFRSDPTHTPLTLYLRERFGRMLKRRYGVRLSG